jgi:formate hydrogenlyase subunit 3/multisubunit Na+/H+ antiporter MnhD subunit
VIPLGISTWSGPIQLVIDRLSAYFILIINLICLCGIFICRWLSEALHVKEARRIYFVTSFQFSVAAWRDAFGHFYARRNCFLTRMGIDVLVLLYTRDF